MDALTSSSIDTAIWPSMDDADNRGGEKLDANYGPGDPAPETLATFTEDCEALQRDPAVVIVHRHERVGHDFRLTHCGHGAGCRGGDWHHGVGQRLTAAAYIYGSVDLHVGDDGVIHGRLAWTVGI